MNNYSESELNNIDRNKKFLRTLFFIILTVVLILLWIKYQWEINSQISNVFSNKKSEEELKFLRIENETLKNNAVSIKIKMETLESELQAIKIENEALKLSSDKILCWIKFPDWSETNEDYTCNSIVSLMNERDQYKNNTQNKVILPLINKQVKTPQEQQTEKTQNEINKSLLKKMDPKKYQEIYWEWAMYSN